MATYCSSVESAKSRQVNELANVPVSGSASGYATSGPLMRANEMVSVTTSRRAVRRPKPVESVSLSATGQLQWIIRALHRMIDP